MAGLVVIDKKPRCISESAKAAVGELVEGKFLNVTAVNKDDLAGQASAFLKKMERMRQTLVTSSQARNMAQQLQTQIRQNDNFLVEAQAHGRLEVITELL